MPQNTIFLDIETIPSQNPALLDKFRAEVKAPGTHKKPETIAAWMDENREAAAIDALAKTSFDPAHGQICTIGWAVDDGEIDAAHARVAGDEAHVIRAFFGVLRDYTRSQFVGHYIGGFDLRFILCRAVVLGVKIPLCIPRDPKPWDGKMFDTMTAWAGARGTISLDNLCAALSIPGKGDGLDGSQVAHAWADGRHDEIAQYCRDDVQRVRAVWQKFQDAGWSF